jgi:hypothetical protein
MRLGPDGLLYIASGYSLSNPLVGQVDRFNPLTGDHLGEITQAHVERPQNLVFGPDGLLYVGNQSSVDDVVRIDPDSGDYLGVFVSDDVNPQGMLFRPNGDLLLATGGRAVKRYEAMSGAFLEDFLVLPGDDPFASSIVQMPHRVIIDIKPRIRRNIINLTNGGKIAVAILGSLEFDVATVDRSTLEFGPGGARPTPAFGPHTRDIDDDGFADLVSLYEAKDAGIGFGDSEACLAGRTFEGDPLEGCDTIDTLSGCGYGYEVAWTFPLLYAYRRKRNHLNSIHLD